MSFSAKLNLLEDRDSYTGTYTTINRWGQLLRESPLVSRIIQRGKDEGLLVPLHDLVTLRGGVVTRANAYFIVRELDFEEVPSRFRLTRRDYQRVAVVMDGLETPSKIERAYLRPIIKGPEALMSPSKVEEADLRLFVVDEDRETLARKRSTGVLDYLRRGETVSYNISEDSLKGGIPAERSQIKNRRPYWYSLTVPTVTGPRIVIPEHLDKRYIATLLDASNESVVIDKLFVAEPHKADHAELIVASLNSLLSWYQIELRGRTQLGQGVLEVKKTDLSGVFVLNPLTFKSTAKKTLLKAFEPLRNSTHRDNLSTVSDIERVKFDELYLKLIGCDELDNDRVTIERELRAIVSERSERRESVAGSKIESKHKINPAVAVDAYATRIATSIEPYPDPRSLVKNGVRVTRVSVTEKVHGKLRVSTELFDQGCVYAGDVVVAQAPDILSGYYIKAVLMHDPTLNQVDVPTQPELKRIMAKWESDIAEWRKRFNEVFSEATSAISDTRLKQNIKDQALNLLHGE
jgi:hypothetical protein